MIIITDMTLPADNVINKQDYYIGVVGDNDYEFREFRLPRDYHGKDIGDGYTFTLDVENSEGKYINPLMFDVDDEYIYLKWRVKKHDCVKGKIAVQIKATSTTDEVIKQSYPMIFECIQNIDALEAASTIPPDIFEQAVAEATAQADRAKQEADRIAAMMNGFTHIKELVGIEQLPIPMEFLDGGSLASITGYVVGLAGGSEVYELQHPNGQPSSLYYISRDEDMLYATSYIGSVMNILKFDLSGDNQPILETIDLAEG